MIIKFNDAIRVYKITHLEEVGPSELFKIFWKRTSHPFKETEVNYLTVDNPLRLTRELQGEVKVDLR